MADFKRAPTRGANPGRNRKRPKCQTPPQPAPLPDGLSDRLKRVSACARAQRGAGDADVLDPDRVSMSELDLTRERSFSFALGDAEAPAQATA